MALAPRAHGDTISQCTVRKERKGKSKYRECAKYLFHDILWNVAKQIIFATESRRIRSRSLISAADDHDMILICLTSICHTNIGCVY